MRGMGYGAAAMKPRAENTFTRALRVPLGKSPPRPIADANEWAKFHRPTRADAAWYLRQLAAFHDLSHEWRIRLHLIAECIEGTARWHKASAITPAQQIQVEMYARMVDKRNPDVSVSVALDAVARNYAAQNRIDEQQARERISEARKRLRRRAGKSGK